MTSWARRLTLTVALLMGTLFLTATPSQAAYTGKGAFTTYCGSVQMNSSKTTISAVCNGPGNTYRFEALMCSSSTCVWKSSAWTPDGQRATISGGYVGGVGGTMYWCYC